MVFKISILLQFFIMIFYYNRFLHRKEGRHCTVLLCALFFATALRGFLQLPPLCNFAVSSLLCLAAAFSAYSDGFIKRLFAAVIYINVMMLCEVISNSILSGLLSIDYSLVPDLRVGQMALLTNTLSFVFLFYIAKIPSKKIRDLPSEYWAAMFLMPIFSVIILVIFDVLIIRSDIGCRALLSIIFWVGLMYIDMMMFDFFENYSARRQLEESERIISSNKQNYDILKNNEEELRILKHDLIKHINIIRDLLGKGKYAEAEGYMNRLDDAAQSIGSVTYTGCLVLDSVLNVEAARARALGIKYLVKSSLQSEVRIKNIDLTTILCNALDNAIEAAAAADKKYTVVTLEVNEENMYIRIENSYNSRLVSADGKTTKPDTVNHGFGISSIKKSAEKYGGKISNERTAGINTLEITLGNHS